MKVFEYRTDKGWMFTAEASQQLTEYDGETREYRLCVLQQLNAIENAVGSAKRVLDNIEQLLRDRLSISHRD